MSEKRYYKFLDDKQEWVVRDRTNRRNEYRIGRNKRYAEKIVDLLNSLSEENERLKQKIKNLDLNEKKGTIKMIDGKVFIKM